jgi:hypothetical protein
MWNRLCGAVMLCAAAAVAGCGGGHEKTTTTAASPSTTSSTTTAAAPPPPPSTRPGALQADARSAATGDIPDNQVFLTYRNTASGYSVKYPEGWLVARHGAVVTVRDKNNIIRIVVDRAPSPTASSLSHGLRVSEAPRKVALPGGKAWKLVYTTLSAANPVTGKRVRLTVDRYALTRAGSTAVVDLGTPVGVDNVDAYRLIIESFRWK